MRGHLSTTRVPDFKAVQGFAGKWYHTGRGRPMASTRGQRVAVRHRLVRSRAIPIIAKAA